MTRALDLQDGDVRTLISDALDDTFVVEAAAGTGKTTELVTRIVQVLAKGRARMDEVVAVTFTEKAAGELKLRLREALEVERSASTDTDTRARLEGALRTLEEAHVNTIHGFCAELLRERPVEARIDPLFSVLTEPQAERLYARAFRAWLQDALEQPPEGVRRALRRSSGSPFGGLEDSGPIERLRSAGWTLAGLRDFPQPWSRPPFDREGAIARLIQALHRLADMSAVGSSQDNLYQSLDRVRRDSQQIRLEQSLGQRDLDGWESRLIDLSRDQGLSKTRKGYGAKYGTLPRSDVLAARDAFYADLLQFRSDADGDLAALLQSELQTPTVQYQELKRRKGAVDFTDLLTCTRDLLREDGYVRRHLQQRFARIFVDEFQDTDPVQAEILLLLSADAEGVNRWRDVRPRPGKLFIVGDPKQAIYRFRGADVGTYWAVRDHLEQCGGRVLQLTTNFRSVPAIQRFVNAAFEQEMVADPLALQAGYVPLAERRPAEGVQPALVALPVPAPYSTNRFKNAVTNRAVEASLPDAIGAFIAWLVKESKWKVVERQVDGTERPVPIEARHVAVLFRRFTSWDEDMTRPYIEALDARGIPHLLVGGKAFHDREEVEAIRAALAAIEWPDDELAVFATLKGSLFAIDDERLLEYRHRFGGFHPFRIAAQLGGNSGTELTLDAEPTAHLLPIADALRLLQGLHRRRNYHPVADTIAELLDATRAHVGFMLRASGEQALANVLHVAELARQYEAEGGISFRGFIDQLRLAAAATGAAEAPIVEEGSEGVRLMTVHKAKGLEFPVVVLADLTCRLSRDDASRHLDASRGLCAVKVGGWAPHDLHAHELDEVARDRAEGIRLAYVAATRARDLLVVPAIGDEPWESGWLAPLNRALYPPAAARQGAERAPQCPPVKSKDSVLVRSEDRMPDARTVAPGLHAFDNYSVVWWDPRWLTLGLKASFGVRRQELIVKDVAAAVVSEGRSRYDAWRAARADARSRGSAPSLHVDTVRRRTADATHPLPSLPINAAEITVEDVRATSPFEGGRRPIGPAFGLLVHAVLAAVPLDADTGAALDVAASEGRALGVSDAEIAAAAKVASRVLAHDVMRRARTAAARGACRRESPVTLLMPDGALVEGIVDLAFEEGGRWTVVDYKTDWELAGADEERYRRQIALYASAIAQATGQPASGVLVRI